MSIPVDTANRICLEERLGLDPLEPDNDEMLAFREKVKAEMRQIADEDREVALPSE